MNLNKTDKVILGIDPGTVVMGYGIIHITGNNLKLVSAGVLALDKKEDHFLRIKEIFDNNAINTPSREGSGFLFCSFNNGLKTTSPTG